MDTRIAYTKQLEKQTENNFSTVKNREQAVLNWRNMVWKAEKMELSCVGGDWQGRARQGTVVPSVSQTGSHSIHHD